MRDAQERQRWQNCLAAMRLSGQQQEQLLLNRRTHLQRMRAIYEERQSLNMQVRGSLGTLATSAHQGSSAVCPGTLSGTCGGRLTACQWPRLAGPPLARPHTSPRLPPRPQAMSEMLPHGGLAGGHDTSVEGRLACLSEAGFTPVAKSSAELGEVLDRIKVNEWKGAACLQEGAGAWRRLAGRGG